MNILVTGGSGFLGRRLIRKLLRNGTLSGPDGQPQSLDRITLVDVAAAEDLSDPRLTQVIGDISDAVLMKNLVDRGTTAIFHLAAIVSGMAEADFELGMRINLDASRLLLDACRASGHCPRVVFASSVAVYGGELPDTVLDTTVLRPQSSYGTQKAIVELLINDYSRRGFVDGRVLRLPTISVRPGRPNAAASSFASGIIREPLNGEDAVCPVDPDTRLWLLSPTSVIENLVRGHDVPAAALGASRIVNLPGLSISVREMVAALERVAGPDAVARIAWQRDPRIERIVATWPGAWETSRALALGFKGDESFDQTIRAHIEEHVHRGI
jgi:nucleoside-diphosphate-sugar epimerase